MVTRVRLAACLSGLLAVGCMGTATGGATLQGNIKGTIKVALVDVFSGDLGFSGAYQQHGMQVEVDRLNAAGGLLGYRLEVAPADGEQRPDKAGALVHELVTDKDVKLLVGPRSTDAYLAAKAQIAQARMPNCLTGVAAADALQNAPYSFRVQEPSDLSVRALLGYLRKDRPEIKQVGMVYEGDADGHYYDRALADEAGKAGLTYVGAEFLSGPEADRQAPVKSLLARGAQAIFLSNNPSTAGHTAAAVDQVEQNRKVLLLGFGGMGTHLFTDLGGQSAVGAVFAASPQPYRSGVAESGWPAGYRDFVHRITNVYGSPPNGAEIPGMPAAADCVLQWAAAVRKAGSFDGAAVATAWQTLAFGSSDTALGARETLSPNKHDALAADSIFVYEWTRSGGHLTLKQRAGPA